MAQMHKTVVFQERPSGQIDPSRTFRMEMRPRPSEADLKDGEILIQNLYISLDPTMRGWLDDNDRSYMPGVALNDVMRSLMAGRIIASRFSGLEPGHFVAGISAWEEYSVLPGKDVFPVDCTPPLKLTDSLGLMGVTGVTAYFSMLEIGDPKPGELVVVSTAAGATGSVACQLAKIRGARVVGITGSAEKAAWLRDLGCDEALNYRDADFEEQFGRVTDNKIDVYFDNVGGRILELALDNAKPYSRFVMCGSIAQYNSDVLPPGPSNFIKVIQMRIRMIGFIIIDHFHRFPEAQKQLKAWLAEGKLQRKEMILKGGLEKAPEALRDLFAGVNIGKLMVEISPP